MALGDLSPDQQAYRDKFVAATGMDPKVVTAWIGTESGWNVTKPSHNYLNVGPGRSYPSVDAAVKDAAQTAHDLTGIINGKAVPISSVKGYDELQAIVTSRWGTGSELLNVYSDLYQHGGGSTIDQIGNAIGGAASGAAGAVGNAVGGLIDINALGRVLLTVALGSVFTITALGLIVLGLERITGRPVTDHLRQGLQAAAPYAAAAAAV